METEQLITCRKGCVHANGGHIFECSQQGLGANHDSSPILEGENDRDLEHDDGDDVEDCPSSVATKYFSTISINTVLSKISDNKPDKDI